MISKYVSLAAAALLLSAAAVYLTACQTQSSPKGFVIARGSQFAVDGAPFRFVGANVAVMYGDQERSAMPETLQQAARDGVRVVRVWAFGEGGENASPHWQSENAFRRAPDDWNEKAFIHLDRVLVEAAKNNLRVQICLTNWWRDTGGVGQYLRWAGISDAADDKQPYGINTERAMLFYSNQETRRLYREHLQRIVGRRNSVSGVLYKDDPTIFAYELMNEAQAPAGRYDERRAWVAEMSAYVKSLDSQHLLTPGTWGYRSSWERRAWLAEHKLPTVDFCDVHHYPRDDLDSFVDSPEALGEFMDNRAAAAFSINKPLVFGEFGMMPEGYNGHSELDWFRAYFAHAARVGAAGAMYWVFTPDAKRGYAVSYTTTRSEPVRAEITRAANIFSREAYLERSARLLNSDQHLIPHQFVFTQDKADLAGQIVVKESGESLIYRFSPEQAVSGRFERIGGGIGYVWGNGMGFFEYVVPKRQDWRRIGEIIVRVRAQPVPPWDARGRISQTSITLFINNTNCGSRLIALESSGDQQRIPMQEWRVNSPLLRFAAARGASLRIRLTVTADAEQPYGLNITKFEDFNVSDRAPIEIELH